MLYNIKDNQYVIYNCLFKYRNIDSDVRYLVTHYTVVRFYCTSYSFSAMSRLYNNVGE